MPENDDLDMGLLAHALAPSPAFKELFETHSKLAATLSGFDAARLIATVGGLLSTPDLQSATLRLEVLAHFVVARAKGHRKAKTEHFKAWLNELGNGQAGTMEDPSEDVFASRVLVAEHNCLVLEGIYESSAFQLRRFVNILYAMPEREPYSHLKRACFGLLQLSNEVLRRAGIAPFVVGHAEPIRHVSGPMLRHINLGRERVTFTLDDLETLGTSLNDLSTFIFNPDDRDRLENETLGHSSLERSPLINLGERLIFALPTAVSIAIRRMVIEFCLSAGMEASLYGALKQEITTTFLGMPLLGGRPSDPLPFQLQSGVYVANIARFVDKGRLLHICFVVDGFNGYDGMNVADPDSQRMSKAIDDCIAHVHKTHSPENGFKQGLTLIVMCPWGRPLAFGFNGVDDDRWRVTTVSAADLELLSWTPSFSPLSLWRLLDAQERFAAMNVQLLNFNGLLNLYAWSEALEGHLVPHGTLPDDHDPDVALMIWIEQNGLLKLRQKGAQSWNLHHAKTWDGRVVRVRREHPNAIFTEDLNAPLYVSMDDLRDGRLVAVFESDRRGWWATVESPNIEDRGLQYRLWHMLTVWLRRGAGVLEGLLTNLPPGPIAWIFRFEDTGMPDVDEVIPNREQAAALLEINVLSNVIHVIGKRGFLATFRNPTNIGESLIAESLVIGGLRMAGEESGRKRIEAILPRIVPDEWARDVHFFAAQEFRDFVREKIPRKAILISKADDAYSRIGLGWRTRRRSEGAYVKGVDKCCAYLAQVTDDVWAETKSILKVYNKELLLKRLAANNEAVAVETEQWLRTARAVLALHEDKAGTAEESARQIAKFNGGALSTRILMEMALCECPEIGGGEAGRLDISRLQANIMQIHHMGGWSEAIKYGGKAAEIRITPLGDVHTQVDFDDDIATPYGQALGVKRFRFGASRYERHFRQLEPIDRARDGIDERFWNAWLQAYGFTIDELRVFLDNIEDEGLNRREPILVCTFEELAIFSGSGKLPRESLRDIFRALTLAPRPSWNSAPAGFQSKDWYPWRFRRRLSLISRPIVQLDAHDNPRYLIVPGMVREGALKVIDYCYRGGYEAKFFPEGEMRSWIGQAENRRGHDFNDTVCHRLKELGWETRANINMTEILNAKLDRNYGDVDVLAWKVGRVLAIECKDLELAMTIGDIARQLHEFRGEIGPAPFRWTGS